MKSAFNLFEILLFFALFSRPNRGEVTESEDETLIEDFVICRNCGADVGLSNFLINKLSPSGTNIKNETIFGKTSVLVQDLENPLGYVFRVIVLKQADCVKFSGNWVSSSTWFIGYAWKLCFCPKCALHIGWMFEPTETAVLEQQLPSENGFYVLVLNNVISEKYLNSLFVTHKFHEEL